MSIYSVIVGGDSINCHNAFEIGKKLVHAITGETFESVKFPRKNKILTLKAAHSSVKINNETVAIDPLLLFQRISTNISNKDDMKTYLQNELAPFPVALFTETGFRKNTRSDLYTEIRTIESFPTSDETVRVVDGGFLLHKVPWKRNDTIDQITDNYVKFVRNQYAPNTYVVFDGYPDIEGNAASASSSSTKTVERLRRKILSSVPDLEFDYHTKIPYQSDKFLSNGKKQK